MNFIGKLSFLSILLLVITTQVYSKAIKHCYVVVKGSKNIKAIEDGKYQITLGNISMIIDAEHGAKILSYKLGDDEVLNQGDAPNSFGSTFWTSPQKEWDWPPVEEYDTKPFTAKIKGNKLILTGQKSPLGYRIQKEFTIDKKKKAINITYTIINESAETRKVAPWEITRVPNDEGVLFFEANKVEEANNMSLLPFTFKHGGAWYTMDESDEFRKINADGRGWLGYCNRGLLFVKKFQDLKPGQAAPAEAEIQAYGNMGKTFVEVEEQGAYTTLKPGASVSWTVRWFLTRTNLKAVPSAALFKQAKKIAK
ncbi:hypothetical protein PIROE2DRAFT_14675 [Piromyces sp. E2]|nr:hypothetical protein PIROE2DRAFT_14675 [Piromyces sp. E2]|eukprot:OUM59705.1 hypothetical protein PIROE2DRAFT_14675 [Piromyces sp. E2]